MAKDGKINPNDYKLALSNIEKLAASQKKLEEHTEKMKGTWDSISNTLLGVSGSEFFEKVTKSSADIAKQAESYRMASESLGVMGNSLDESFKKMKSLRNAASKITKGVNESQIKENLMDKIKMNVNQTFIEDEDKLKKIADEMMEMAKKGEKMNEQKLKDLGITKEGYKEMLKTSKSITEELNKPIELPKRLQFLNVLGNEYLKKKYVQAIAEGKVSELIKEEGVQAALILNTDKQINKTLGKNLIMQAKAVEEVEYLGKKMQEVEKTQFNLAKGLQKWGANLFSSVIKKLVEFDNVIHQVQRSTGIMFTENTQAMAELTRKTAQFGMSIEQTAQFMGIMSDTLNTTNFGLLSKATEDLAAIQLATGMSAESLGTMAAEMMRMGASSEDVKNNLIGANKTAKMFGVNSKKALESISKNFVKFRTMGFQGGIESLQKMTAMALRLGQNIDEIFNMADKARNIEGAMEMAAELQLAGGSFANVNPMDLLSAARKGPQELQKILGKMGSDIGKFDAKTGKMTFDPVDKDRLQIVANATGETLEGIQNRITKMNQDNVKLNLMPPLKFEGMKDKDGNDIDPESIKALLSDSVDMTGKVLEGSLLDKEGIKDISKLGQGELERIMKKKAADDANLEEQARQNQSLMESFSALKEAFLNIFTKLQPVMNILTTIFQAFSRALSNWYVAVPILVVALTVFAFKAVPQLVSSLGSMWAGGKQFIAKFVAMFRSGPGGIISSIKSKFMGGAGAKLPLTKTPGADIPDKKSAGAGSGLVAFAKSLQEIGNTKIKLKGILEFAAAIAILLLPVAGLALIFGKLGGDPLILLAMAAALVGLAFSIKIIGQTKVDIKNIMMMALAMAIVGIAMIPFAFAASLMNGVDWMSVLIAVGILALIILGLVLIGVMMTGPQLIGLLIGVAVLVGVALSLLIVGIAFLALAKGLNALAKVDWAAFSGIGPALLQVSLALGAFALAGLLFMNPIMMVGMLLMIGTLLAISIVLIPLALALEMGGKGLNSMASGVMKLSDSLSKLDMAKLGELKAFSQGMALAALGGAAMMAMVAVIEAIGKLSGGGASGNAGAKSKERDIIIQLKMPNGVLLEQQIVHDIENRQ